MFVELLREEAQLLSQLIHTRLKEAEQDAPTNGSRTEDEVLRHQLERLEHRLHEAEWDVTC